MGLQLEFAKPGELYMITQGSGGGYGDVLEREPAAVSEEYLDELISLNTVKNIYHVVLDEVTGAIDTTATEAARKAERQLRISRGKSYDEFVAGWETEFPPADIPYYGSWKERDLLYLGNRESTCPADNIVSVMMRDPKDVRIEQLEQELAAAKTNG